MTVIGQLHVQTFYPSPGKYPIFHGRGVWMDLRTILDVLEEKSLTSGGINIFLVFILPCIIVITEE